jgi:hypothetical protein
MSIFRSEIDQLAEVAESIDRVGDMVCTSVARARARWARVAVATDDRNESFFLAGFALGLVKAGRADLLSSYPSARNHAIELGLLREDLTPVTL